MISLKWAFVVSFTASLGLTVVAVRAWRARRVPPVPPTQQEQDALALSRQDAEGGPPRHDEPVTAPLPRRNGVHARTPRELSNAELRAWIDVSPR